MVNICCGLECEGLEDSKAQPADPGWFQIGTIIRFTQKHGTVMPEHRVAAFHFPKHQLLEK